MELLQLFVEFVASLAGRCGACCLLIVVVVGLPIDCLTAVQLSRLFGVCFGFAAVLTAGASTYFGRSHHKMLLATRIYIQMLLSSVLLYNVYRSVV